MDRTLTHTIVFEPPLEWSPGMHEQHLGRIKRPKKKQGPKGPSIRILHASLSCGDLTTDAKGSKTRKLYLKRKYLGKDLRKESFIKGELGMLQGMSITYASQYSGLKFPTPTQVFHKRKKQKRALTGRR